MKSHQGKKNRSPEKKRIKRRESYLSEEIKKRVMHTFKKVPKINLIRRRTVQKTQEREETIQKKRKYYFQEKTKRCKNHQTSHQQNKPAEPSSTLTFSVDILCTSSCSLTSSWPPTSRWPLFRGRRLMRCCSSWAIWFLISRSSASRADSPIEQVLTRLSMRSSEHKASFGR